MEGLYYCSNVITDEIFLKEIMNELNSRFLTGESFGVGNSKNSRKVIHYGYEYNYKTGNVGKETAPFPPFIQKLADLIKSTGIGDGSPIVQCIINRYEPGQGIGAHVDSEKYGEFIYCFTFGSGADMEFTRALDDGIKRNIVHTEHNSLYIMSGDSRHNWKHEMKPRLTDTVNGKKIHRGIRISITFRSIKK